MYDPPRGYLFARSCHATVELEAQFERLEGKSEPMHFGFLGEGRQFMRSHRSPGHVSMKLRTYSPGIWHGEVLIDRGRYEPKVQYDRGPFVSVRFLVTSIFQELNEPFGSGYLTRMNIHYSGDRGGYDCQMEADDHEWLRGLFQRTEAPIQVKPLDVLIEAFTYFARRVNPHWKVVRTLLIREDTGLWRVGVNELGSEVSSPVASSPEDAVTRAIHHLAAVCKATNGIDRGDQLVLDTMPKARAR